MCPNWLVAVLPVKEKPIFLLTNMNFNIAVQSKVPENITTSNKTKHVQVL